MAKELVLINFSSNDADNNKLDIIVNNLAELSAASFYETYGNHGMIEKVEISDYKDRNEKVKQSILGFAASKSGLDSIPKTATEMAFAMDNQMFRTIVNSITTRALSTMMVRYKNPQIEMLADIETVGLSETRSYEIDTKALPIAQRATYGSNVTMVPSYAKSSITVTPIPYSLGISLDYIRIVANGYDWGAAVARVYAGMVFAQYKLIVDKVFDTNILNGTPFYVENFAPSTYVQLAQDISMLNGSNIDSVVAMGTLVAWNSISALATKGGYTTIDEYIRNGYLGKIYGVNSLILDQITNLSAPFTTANATKLRAIPDNLIVLISSTDKICKLVREDYVRVYEQPANTNSLNKNEYSYFQSFDAKIATASYFGLQGTTQA